MKYIYQEILLRFIFAVFGWVMVSIFNKKRVFYLEQWKSRWWQINVDSLGNRSVYITNTCISFKKHELVQIPKLNST